jgi:uncharacterized membrane protein
MSEAATKARPLSWLWAPFVAAAPGWTSYILSHPDADALLRENVGLAPKTAALHMLVGAVVVLGMWAALKRRLARGWLEAVLSTRWLLLGPIVLALRHDEARLDSPGRLILVLVGGLLVAVSIGHLGLHERVRRVLNGRYWPAVVVSVGTGLVVALMLRLALWRHHGFLTRAFDLGIYDNLVWNTAHGDFLACTLIKGGVHTSAHFDPILAGVSLIYLAAPRAETLIVVQALWLFSGVIPVYLIAMRRLDDRLAATILALGFALYPSVQGVALYEFHSLALLATPVLWMIWCLEDHPIGYWIAFALGLLVREDASLLLVGVGIYVLLDTPHRRRAILTIGIALAYLAFVKLAIMPDPDLLMRNSDVNYTYANRYRGLVPEGGGARDALATLLTNPGFVLAHVLTTRKVLIALAFVVPLGLLPLAGGRRLLLAVYGVAFLFLASYPNIYFPLFHYSTMLYPALFAATPEGLARVREWLVSRGATSQRARAAVLGYLGTCVVLGNLSMGLLVKVEAHEDIHGGILRSFGEQERESYAWFREQTAAISNTATVTASNRCAPHLSNRAELYIVQQRIESDWFVVHLDDLTPEERKWIWSLVIAGAYEEVAKGGGGENGDFWILRRLE